MLIPSSAPTSAAGRLSSAPGPRWGHKDLYTVTMTLIKKMGVAHDGLKTAICELDENGDPKWSRYDAGADNNPLMAIFANDMIHAPDIVPFALE
jgi:hypothetical protein